MAVQFGDVRSLLRLVIFIFSIGIFLLASPSTAKADADSVLVRVTVDAYADVHDIEAIHTIDYGAFVWLELTPANLALLEQRGVPYERQRDPHEFKIQGLPIDMNSTAPANAAASLSISGAEPVFHVIQLLGPAKDEWIAELNVSGIEILQYADPYGYLVRMTTDQASRAGSLTFVRGVGPFMPQHRISPELLDMEGVIENASVTIYDDADPEGTVKSTIAAIEALGGVLVMLEDSRPMDKFAVAQFRISAESIEALAGMRDVAWIRFRAPFYPDEDEMSSQINAGNFNPLVAGYQNWLTNVGFDGTGVTIAALDRGYDTGVDGTAHPDISGRSVMVSDSVGIPTDQNGHGTHVGGIMAGNASLGTADASSFLMGLGVAPQATLVVRRRTIDSDQQQTTDAVQNGAVASNHSYGLQAAGSGYTNRDRTYDMLVRDADTTTANVAEPLIIVFSAGNSGNNGPSKEAKNVIAVGSSRNQRDGAGNPGFGNINTISGSSSRGPTGDGRLYPHVSAPGGNIISTRYRNAVAPSCDVIATGAPAMDPTYSMCSGTSMAAPHVTGSMALITEWWQSFNVGAVPSPAMAKALLVNGAVDMGTADIPNNNEGWGRVNLDNVINAGIATQYFDQTTVFGGTGASWSVSFSPADLGQQVRVSLAWTDAAGAAGANPALVNDLDLVITDSTNTFRGNNFANGLSTPGGVADTLNNLENVFVQNPEDAFTVTVTAAAINGDGIPYNPDTTDQDFALVCTNCAPNEPPVCDANGPYVAECSVDTGLDGSGSSDPDNDPLSYEWSGPFTGSPVAGATPTVQFPSPTGAKSVDLEVNDGLASDFCSAPVTVQDTLAPTVTAPADITAECASPDGTPVDIGLAAASDICDISPTIGNDAPALFDLGLTTVTWTGTDDDGNVGLDTQDVTIEDTIPPEITTLELSPDVLWPPNHKYVTVTAMVEATDICDADPEITLVSVVSNEPDNAKGNGDGDTTDDIVIVDDFTLQLRAERAGRGSGRIYTVTYQAEDDSGNLTVEQAIVSVPKSQ